jgi:hypothetical protein
MLRAIGAVKHITSAVATDILTLSCFKDKNCALDAGSSR